MGKGRKEGMEDRKKVGSALMRGVSSANAVFPEISSMGLLKETLRKFKFTRARP